MTIPCVHTMARDQHHSPSSNSTQATCLSTMMPFAGPELGKVSAEHFRQGAVMKRYKEMFNTATICAFNPMIDDFLNARFFFGDSLERLPPGSHTAERSPISAKRRLALAAASTAIKPPLPAAPFSKSAVNPPKNPVYPTFGGKGVRPMKKKF